MSDKEDCIYFVDDDEYVPYLNVTEKTPPTYVLKYFTANGNNKPLVGIEIYE